ncbi:hypothetical protein ES319_D10G055300v1 [Gossypium barbadense]|uniref:Uncharacterized protein n=2 Tax=Gossypium TaxID=3633 RepID=A0A5J5PMH3_GOSBA|nr:hypothetical protein ES319_D10G055300v1 [Gossypium barbadense]TYH48307.1 hypothetical protein ES332_D10G059100v1 [Gossypium tomentosum]
MIQSFTIRVNHEHLKYALIKHLSKKLYTLHEKAHHYVDIEELSASSHVIAKKKKLIPIVGIFNPPEQKDSSHVSSGVHARDIIIGDRNVFILDLSLLFTSFFKDPPLINIELTGEKIER